MSETAIASLIAASEDINPLLEILWKIEQYQQQGNPLIELTAIGRASPIAAPMTIRGF
jgi:hypothetical protein